MSEGSVREPAVAGQFYPADPDRLQRDVQDYIDRASLPPDLGKVRALIAPHAGYVYSGITAGYAFKALREKSGSVTTVFLLGPAHRMPVNGVALGSYSAFRTPLGAVPVAVDRVAVMLEEMSIYTRAPDAHRSEHCLEVQLPFLQVSLTDFELVPMLYGDVEPGAVADDLVSRLTDDDMVLVSSDLSHFHPYSRAQRRDQNFLDGLLKGDEAGVRSGEACGRAPVMTLMEISQREGWEPHLLDYRNSGDTSGDRSRVVGYASVAYAG